jgi:hypothetical protein
MKRRIPRVTTGTHRSARHPLSLPANLAWVSANIAVCVLGAVRGSHANPVMINQAYSLGLQLITGNHFSPGPVIEVLALLSVLASVRWLVIDFRLFLGTGAVEVRPLDDASGQGGVNSRQLDVLFREYLTLPRLYQVTSIPGDPDPDRLIEVLRSPAYSGWRELLAAAYAYAFPRRMFVVSATLRTREHEPRRYGVSIQVRKLPGYAIELESQWSGSFERALQRAAYAVGAYILPYTRHCRNVPWTEWRGRVLPVSLFRDYQRAKRLADERRYDEALALYSRALLQDSNNIGIRYDLGQLYERIGLYPDALCQYMRLANDVFPVCIRKGHTDPRRTARPYWRPGPSADSFVIRFRYAVVLGLGTVLACELAVPSWPELHDWINPRPDFDTDELDTERRPWRTIELLDMQRRLSEELDRLFPSLAEPSASAGTLLHKLDLARNEYMASAIPGAMLHAVERYLLECARRETVALAQDFQSRRALAWRSGRRTSSLTLTVVRQSLVVNKYRFDRLAGASRGIGTETWWPHSLSEIEDDLRRAGYDAKVSANWLEHYYAACIYALALMDDTQEAEEHREYAYAAVAALERALGCGEDVDFVRANRQWLQAGDPDLAGLRRYGCFRTFESRVYGRPLPAAEDLVKYELYLYLRNILEVGAESRELEWRRRAAREDWNLTYPEFEDWWRQEERAWELAVRLGRFYRQWQTRRFAVEGLRDWLESFGAEVHPVPYPDLIRAEYRAEITDYGKITETLIGTEEIFRFLGSECGNLRYHEDSEKNNVVENTRLWSAYARECSSSRHSGPPRREPVTAACLARASVWAALRHWVATPDDKNAAALREAIARLSHPPS